MGTCGQESNAMNPFDLTDIHALADALIAARKDRAALVPSSLALPRHDQDAYRVQQTVMQKLGAEAVAWKVGAPNAETTPNCAPIFALHHAGAPIRVEPSTGVEVEIAFKLAKGFEASRTKPTRAAVEADISSAHIAIEVCASRLKDQLKAPPLLQLADNGNNLGLIVSAATVDWRAIDPKTLVTHAVANGTTIAQTTAGHTTGDLVGLLTWLVGHCVTERGGIAAGSVVTTGSWMGIRWVDTPADVRAVFDGIGELVARLEA